MTRPHQSAWCIFPKQDQLVVNARERKTISRMVGVSGFQSEYTHHLRMKSPVNMTGSIAPCPLQYLQIASPSSMHTRCNIPRAAVGPSPLQHVQVVTSCSISTCSTIPWIAVFSGPLQHFQNTSVGRARTKIHFVSTSPIILVGPPKQI
jgi:hypothetical protein